MSGKAIYFRELLRRQVGGGATAFGATTLPSGKKTDDNIGSVPCGGASKERSRIGPDRAGAPIPGSSLIELHIRHVM